MPQPIRSAGREIYRSANSTATSFTLTGGAKTAAPVDQAAVALPVVILGEGRGWKIQFFGVGADNTTFSAKLWGVDFTQSVEGGERIPTDYVLTEWGSVAVTLGTEAVVGTAAAVSSTAVYADTLVYTAATACTNAEAAYGLGTTTAYSPADNNTACLFVPNFPFHGLIIDFDLTGATSANAVVQRTA